VEAKVISFLEILPIPLDCKKSRTRIATDLLAIPDNVWNRSSVVCGCIAASDLASNSTCIFANQVFHLLIFIPNKQK
jgi:hypothetical protein